MANVIAIPIVIGRSNLMM